jgi:hypothetical protein
VITNHNAVVADFDVGKGNILAAFFYSAFVASAFTFRSEKVRG